MLFGLLRKISCIKYFKSNSIAMQGDSSTRQILEENKKLLDDLVKRRYIYFQGSEIYGGCAGLYDFGPIGCAIKNNIEQLWREHFILEEDMLEINTTCITPSVVFENSGHVTRFADFMVKDVKSGQGYRADKVLLEWAEDKLKKGKLKEDEAKELKEIVVKAQGYKQEQLTVLFKKYEIKNKETGNLFSEPVPFNLMFRTDIGHSANNVGYLRPETAQGMFVNFSKLLDYNGGRLPFASAQIGLGFRNEIAPRTGLVRVREFPMAEIQHFFDPQITTHSKFKSVADIKVPLLSADAQVKMGQHEWLSLGKAVEEGLIKSETMGYFMGRIFLFLKESGANVQDHLRFRQHLSTEMAHYANDCWDAELEFSTGWVQCVGCANRSAYDLDKHTLGSGHKLVAARKFKEARPEKQTSINFERKEIGKTFKKDSQQLYTYLEGLNEEQKADLAQKFEPEKQVTLSIEGKQFILTQKLINFQQKIVNINEQKYTPNVIEPAFGMGRILAAVLEHCFKKRDDKRTYVCLKPRIAPVKVSILPLQGDQRFAPVITDIKKQLKKNLISCKVDDTGQSIGRRYARTDEIGIPFGTTVDYQTLEDQTVTLRELHTMKQLRVPLSELYRVITSLSNEVVRWEDVCKEFPAFQSDAKDE